eukprot:gene45502-62560_t
MSQTSPAFASAAASPASGADVQDKVAMAPVPTHTAHLVQGRVTNWTLESAGASSRCRGPPRDTASLRTDDIAGAKTGTSPLFRAARFANKPSGFYNNDIAGSTPKRAIPERVNKRNDFNMSNKDIEHSSPESNYPQRPVTPPKHRAVTCRTDDIAGTAPIPMHRRPPRDNINYDDVPFSKAGTLSAARKRTTEGFSLTAKDVNYPPEERDVVECSAAEFADAAAGLPGLRSAMCVEVWVRKLSAERNGPCDACYRWAPVAKSSVGAGEFCARCWQDVRQYPPARAAAR